MEPAAAAATAAAAAAADAWRLVAMSSPDGCPSAPTKQAAGRFADYFETAMEDAKNAGESATCLVNWFVKKLLPKSN